MNEEPAMDGGLDHVEIYVSNLDRSTVFWGWMLETFGYHPYQKWDQGISWRKGETYIVLVQAEPQHQQPLYHRKRVGLNHLAFRLSSRDEVAFFRSQLQARGISLLYEDRYPHSGGPDQWAVFFEDPDRIKLEVVYRSDAAKDSGRC